MGKNIVCSQALRKEEDCIRQRPKKEDEKNSIHKQEGYNWERSE